MLTVCLLLVAFAASHKQVAPDVSKFNQFHQLSTLPFQYPLMAVLFRVYDKRRASLLFLLVARTPVPANVFHPSNIARVVLHNELMSIYAGAMTPHFL